MCVARLHGRLPEFDIHVKIVARLGQGGAEIDCSAKGGHASTFSEANSHTDGEEERQA